MATYVIGDIQGCFSTLKELLAKVSFSSKRDTIWVAGDLVNRGANSLECLRWAKSSGPRFRMVLGNHDIHLLAVYFGVKKLSQSDTIGDIIGAPDAAELLGWLRKQKLTYFVKGKLLVHAGFSPKWHLAEVLLLSSNIESLLQGKSCEDFLRYYFNRTIPPMNSDWPKLAEALHILTHIRTCKSDGTLNREFSGSPSHIPIAFRPWYEFSHKSIAANRVFFGHWAAHGFKEIDSFVCLDSGCVWGRSLTAFRLEDGRAFHQTSVETEQVIDDSPI